MTGRRYGVGPSVAFAACVLWACDSAPFTRFDALPAFHSATADSNPSNAISAVVEIHATLYDGGYVRYWPEGGVASSTPMHAFGGDTVITIPVLGLDTNATYTMEIRLVLADSADLPVDTLSFATGGLPEWVPSVGLVGADTTPGVLVLSFPDGPVFVDNTGRVVWYLYYPNGVLNSFQVHPNGQYTILGLDDAAAAFHVIDALGNEIGEIHCIDHETRFHDLLVDREGDAWLLCDETRIMDLSAYGGSDSASVTATVVQHLAPDGAVLFEWNAFDHVAITDLDPDHRSGRNVNFTHGNAIALDWDGNLLLSFRSLNEVMKVDAVTGDVLWRFGGLANEFTIEGDPRGGFARQHGVRPAVPGQVQMLDNGTEAPSRFVRFLINARARTARLVLEFVDDSATFAAVGGSTQYYQGIGHALVSFGRAGRVVEVDEVGNRAVTVSGIDGIYVFRAQRILSVYPREFDDR